MLTFVNICLVLDLAGVDRVGQHRVQRTLIERPASLRGSLLGLPDFDAPATTFEFFRHLCLCFQFQRQRKDSPNPSRFVRIDDQSWRSFASINVIAKHGIPASPLVSFALRRKLVANPLTDNLAFELRERK